MGTEFGQTEKLTKDEKRLVKMILYKTKVRNLDNISRTDAYLQYYIQNKEIHWAFLASLVSRNAGWNMCDLEGIWFRQLLGKEMRNQLFLTYEKANWLIFQDAYPQLLVYYFSKKKKRALFHLLKYFHVSSFMEREWNYFWHYKDYRRLVISLIINEQNIIQKPVIDHHHYQKKVFHSWPFFIQNWLHASSVLFPTCEGSLYGASVNGFTNIHKRIDLGKRLTSILFDENLYPKFFQFALTTFHSGSRYDYERFFLKKARRDTPYLRIVYPVIGHHLHKMEDWSLQNRIKKKWYDPPVHIHPILLTDWFEKKQKNLKKIVLLKQLLFEK